MLIVIEIETKLHKAKQKTAKQLICKLRKERERKIILKFQEDYINNMIIQKSFYDFYSNFYKNHEVCLKKMNEYLKKKHNLPKLFRVQKQNMNSTIITFEKSEAIREIKIGQASGPDRIPSL